MSKEVMRAIERYGNMLRFRMSGDFRPRIQQIDDQEFVICELENGNAYIHKNDIDDLIELLTTIKLNDYKID
jgi:hypothetical protein